MEWKEIEGVYNAAEFIGTNLRWWRVPVRDYKEKWYTVRVYLTMGWHDLHDVCYPGYAYIQFKRDGLLWKLSFSSHMKPLFNIINIGLVPLHRLLYRRAYRLAIKKWPQLRTNILACADYSELLKGL